MKSLVLAAASFLALSSSAFADTITYSLPDLNPSSSFVTDNTGQTFSGTGFVGQYTYNASDGGFGHLFGLEGSYTRTNAQVDLSDLVGKTVTAATLSYFIANNGDQTGTVTISGYASNGELSYLPGPPASTFATATGTTFANNSADVTGLVAGALATGNSYLGLFLEDSVYGNWTYTSSSNPYGYDANSDSAQVRLAVTYADTAPVAVPEPTSLALLGMGVLGLAATRRRTAN